MEKRFREYLKHFEKLDYDVLSDEEIQDEKSNLELKMTILHQELVRILIVMIGMLICTCIFLANGLCGSNLICLILAVVTGLCVICAAILYKSIAGVIKKLDMFVDKLTLL
ncbi:hypothetical protein [Butyrivibrio sp. VCB2006]|uniref:hypothetical protein n=1 Tax=Butyrivibrio sp. VCB2006 TaxID=1280679 RepID=UPI0004031271|nr:hypothetical protein [Butyrivibrio sp. VCB2006]